jgi:hypothetical protein
VSIGHDKVALFGGFLLHAVCDDARWHTLVYLSWKPCIICARRVHQRTDTYSLAGDLLQPPLRRSPVRFTSLIRRKGKRITSYLLTRFSNVSGKLCAPFRQSDFSLLGPVPASRVELYGSSRAHCVNHGFSLRHAARTGTLMS